MVRATKHDEVIRRRVVILTALLLVGLTTIMVRLAYLQIWENDVYRAQAADQHTGERTLEPARGEIRVTDTKTGQSDIVATSVERPLVYAVPPLITDPERTAVALAPLLQQSVEELLPRLSDKNRRYVPLKKQLTDEQRQKIADLKLAGINFDAETIRYYPEGDFLSHVLGYVGYKGDVKRGLYGLEASLQDELAGQGGFLAQERDASGTWIFGTKRNFQPAQDGETVVLTIDKTIQFKAEQVIKAAVTDNLADSGSVVVADPKTGAIIAMATYPSFDPNNYGAEKDPGVFNNQVTMGSYEPGSIMKPLVMAAAINEGVISPQTTYTDTGSVVVDGFTIKNSDLKAHGVQTMTEVLEKSLNTGMIFVREQLGKTRLRQYYSAFGFGERTGIEVSEARGSLKGLEGNITVNYDTASFGQGVSMTPVQMLQAYTSIANGGWMMKPHLIASRITSNGKTTVTEAERVRQVLTADAARAVSAMMVNVVENGHGKKAGVPGYYVAGKTGTAQVPRKDGRGYEENNNIGSFVGFAPVDDPKFVMLVRINHPRTVKYAETTAAPAFGALAKFMLEYYNVAPTRTQK